MTDTKPVIVRNIQTDVLYKYYGNDEYENLITKVRGKIAPDLAKKIFVINLEGTQLINDNPNIEYLINTLQLKYTKNND